MFNLSRTDFPDLLWCQDDLDDIARLWLAWHDQSRGMNLPGLRSYQRVRLRLWGAALPDCEMLAEKLEKRLAAAGLPDNVYADDKDYLSVTASWEPAAKPSPLGEWLGIVNDGVFDGLVLFLELSVCDWPGAPAGPASVGGTLVLCGQLRRNGFLLKAVWPVGLEPGFENLYKLTVWPCQDEFLSAFESFRAGAMPAAPERFFVDRAAERLLKRVVELIIHVPGPDSMKSGRLSSFLFRAGFHLSALTAILLVQYGAPDWPAKALMMALLAIVFAGALAYVVVAEAKRVWAYYWRLKAAMKRVYTRPVEHQAVDLADYGLDTDPNACKYTRELEAVGCQHLGDVRHVGATAGKSAFRVFVLPDERIYVFLMLMASTGKFRKFPAHAHFFLLTRLTEGRIITINEGGGYRKSVVPNVFQRRFPDIDDPAILLAKHRKFVAEVCAKDHTLAPLDDLPALLTHQREDHEKIRPVMEKWGYYSWSAAFRQAFGLVRKEYLEPSG